MVRKPRLKLLVGIALLVLVLMAWIGVGLAYLLFDPTLVQWTFIITAAGVATEVAIWVGAVFLGISALRRFRSWIWRRRSR